jgi:hypothetical protein
LRMRQSPGTRTCESVTGLPTRNSPRHRNQTECQCKCHCRWQPDLGELQCVIPQGANEIAQTLVHVMMHCAGFTHPARRDPPAGMSCAAPNPALFDCPFDNGQYYGTPPLRSELCIAGNQSDVSRIMEKARDETCVIDENGMASIHSA